MWQCIIAGMENQCSSHPHRGDVSYHKRGKDQQERKAKTRKEKIIERKNRTEKFFDNIYILYQDMEK